MDDLKRRQKTKIPKIEIKNYIYQKQPKCNLQLFVTVRKNSQSNTSLAILDSLNLGKIS